MWLAKRGIHLRIARPPIAEFDGRTGSIRLSQDGNSRDQAAQTINILRLDLGIPAAPIAAEPSTPHGNYSS
jgi:hypothetical protein